MDNEMGAPETKAELSSAFGEFMGAFEVFRETNDRRLAELESKSVDVLTSEKLARVEAALDANQRRMDDLVLKGARPSLTGGSAPGTNERKSAFDGYVRSGDESGLRMLERKTLTAAANEGFNVPVEVESEVLRRLTMISPIRAIAGVREVSSASFRKPIIAGGPVAGWVSETADRDVTDAPFSMLQFDTMELYAMPAATTALLDDSAVNMDEWLAEEIESVFAEQETKAFVAGDGNGKPRGFTDYPTVAEDNWSWGNVGVVNTGADGDFHPTAPSDNLIELVYTLKSGYRQNGTFVMSRTTQAEVRKMKDANGAYIWAPPSMPGAKASLLNFAVVEAEDMPEIETGSTSIAFGDFRRGYLIVDRQGLRILRDPFSKKPYVLFYTTKRVGGGIQDFDAIKMLKFSA